MSAPKHIAFLCSSLSWGGLEMNVVRFAGWLREEGFRVSVWCVKESPLAQAAESKGHRCIFIKHHLKYGDLKGAIRLAKLFTVEAVDVVWIRDTRDMSICGWAKRWSSRKLRLIYQQAMQLGVSKRDPIHTDRFKRIDLWIAPLNYLADQVRTMTRYPASRIAVIPLAVDLDRFTAVRDPLTARTALGLPTDRLLIGTVGRIDPLKGQAFLIDQHKELVSRGVEADLVIVGDPTRNEGDAYRKVLMEMAQSPELRGKVHILPHQNDIEQVYAALDIFVMASAGETFGMVTIEAMASGCAIVGTNRSGTPELLADGRGMLYEPGNAASYFEALLPLLENEELRASMAEKASNYAIATFRHERVVEQLKEALEREN